MKRTARETSPMRASLRTLLVAGNLLGLLFALGVIGQILREPPPGQQDPSNFPEDAAIRSEPPATSTAALLMHPLFSISRQPAPISQTLSEQPLALPPPRLAGIVTTDAAPPRALLESSTGEHRTLARLGDIVDGWTLSRIERNTVVVTQQPPSSTGGHEQTLTLYSVQSIGPHQ